MKKSRIALAISGEGAEAVIEWIKQEFDLKIFMYSADPKKTQCAKYYTLSLLFSAAKIA